MIVQISVLVLMLIFYITYFVKIFIQRKQGIKTDNLGKGQKDTKTFLIEVNLKIFTFLIAIVQISAIWLQEYFIYINMFTFNYIGISIALIGVIIFVIAVITMGSSWRAGIDYKAETKLVTNGIYKISRNPAFLGFDLFYIGLTLALNNILLGIFSVIAIILFHFQILLEENHLQSKFKKEYKKYCKKVPRYFII